MNRKFVTAFFIAGFFMLLTASACKTQGKAEQREQNLQGMIKIYGNEPNTWVGIETVPERKIYRVAPSETTAELRTLQGRLLDFTVVLGDTAIPGTAGTATVLSWKPVL